MLIFPELLMSINETVAFEYDINNNPIYIGYARIGGSKADFVWKIKKLIYDANENVTDIQWSEGNDNYDKAWNDRETYSYS